MPVAYWDELEPSVRGGLARRVVVLGAESTGTTTLSRDLAAALRERGGPHALTRWVPEYGRELTVAKLAVARACASRSGRSRPSSTWNGPTPTSNSSAAARTRPSTVPRARAVRCWSATPTRWPPPGLAGRYLGRTTDPVRRSAAALPPRALYLLTSHEGVPFADDGLRDGEHLRPWMTGRFREVLGAGGTPWRELRGDRRPGCPGAGRGGPTARARLGVGASAGLNGAIGPPQGAGIGVRAGTGGSGNTVRARVVGRGRRSGDLVTPELAWTNIRRQASDGKGPLGRFASSAPTTADADPARGLDPFPGRCPQLSASTTLTAKAVRPVPGRAAR